jgi:glycosyltransferase involved in cell wall biosynthesis
MNCRALHLNEAIGDCSGDREPAIEVSVVMPCLNEADTLATCIEKAQRAFREHGIVGEIVVADNGSTDDSAAIATRLGARVIPIQQRGYGQALMGGIAAARGKFIIMGDADDSYDFLEIPKFVARLREGYDLVQGCRLPSAGGTVLPGAMPFLHRWLGNPLLSALVRRWFKAEIHDVYCGLRGFTKEAYARLDQRCTGMEFATEMIVKASLFKERLAEVPITLHPDGRKSHAPHLRTFRDGWRTLRLFLMYSPRWLFVIPGLGMVLAGLAGYALALPGVTRGGITFDAHTLLFASLAMICGYQSLLFAIFAKTFAVNERLLPEDGFYRKFFELVNLERGLLLGAGALIAGLGLLVFALNEWRLAEFGRLDYARTMRVVVPGVTLTALGFQTVLSSFFVSILGMQRREVASVTPARASHLKRVEQSGNAVDDPVSVDYFNRSHPLHGIKTRLAMAARRRMFERVMSLLELDRESRVLDVGVTPDTAIPYNNFFERWYPHRRRLTVCSIEDCSNLETVFPGITFTRLDDRELPFRDAEFDVALSFAVLEHVGTRDDQKKFLSELARVSYEFVAYTPYRYFPIEMHTFFPLVHWLPSSVYRPLWRRLGLGFWADEQNLNLLSRSSLRAILPPDGVADIRLLWTAGWPSNIEIHWRRNV